MKKAFIIIFVFCIQFGLHSQDTLTYEGLIMTRTRIPYKNERSYKGINIKSQLGICDFFVLMSNKKNNYNKLISKGVFFTSDTTDKIAECQLFRDVARNKLKKNILETKLDENLTYKGHFQPPIYRNTIATISKKGFYFWKEWNDKSIYLGRRYPEHYIFDYMIYECRIKYIFIGNVEFESGTNRKAKNENEVFVKYNAPAYFITEIEYFKSILDNK